MVKAPNAVIDSLGAGSFQAIVALDELTPGLHRVPVMVESSARPVQIVSVNPSNIDVQLAEVITQTVEIQLDENSRALDSPALELANTPVLTPTEVTISGARPLVESVESVVVALPKVDVAGPFQRVEPISLLDENGVLVRDVDVEPARVLVGLHVVQRANARDVGIEVVTEGSVPDGYRLVRLVAEPARVTLLGGDGQLAGLGTAVKTLPVDLSQAFDDVVLQVPLSLPPGIDAINGDGEAIRSALVTVEVAPRTGNRVFTRQVEVEGTEALNIRLNPLTVELSVSGPIPLLREVAAEPRLLRVLVEAEQIADLEPGEPAAITPTIIGPEGLDIRMTPQQIEATAPQP